MSWTAERIETVKTMASKGHSALQIAIELGAGFSRCAVIGKLHRMGLKLPGRSASPDHPLAMIEVPRVKTYSERYPTNPDRPKPPYKPRVRKAAPPEVEAELVETDEPEQMALFPEVQELPQVLTEILDPSVPRRIPLLQLGLQECRWPVTPLLAPAADVRFCGHHKSAGKPYCAMHLNLAYQPPVLRSKRAKTVTSQLTMGVRRVVA